MKVKRLEIQGFKSFKDKTVIHFDHNITGIVGPNGCGKSNIVDAFFWVMGEQSYKHMRGNNSEDLIFNGSSKYSPLGLAEATLVLETSTVDTSTAPSGATAGDVPLNMISKEISVTRRLYRSGEGEYLINGTISRLKDIQELFMDTGVGTKGYSVIEQGQIGKIVNSKPDERRLLIEEAAGIAKYKSRKKESLRKMEATTANLSRLTDIIQEIDKGLSSLERQAQKARQYKKYKDELFDKEMTWGRRKSTVFQKKLVVLHRERDILDHDLIGLRAGLQTTENSIEVDQISLVTHSKEAERLRTRIQELAEELSQEKSSLELSRRRQGDLNSQLESLANEKSDLETSLAENQEHLATVTQQAQDEDTAFQEIAGQLQGATAQLNTSRIAVDQARSELDISKRQLMGEMQQISTLSARSTGLLSKVESAREQSERLVQQKELQAEKISTIEEELAKSRGNIIDIQGQRATLQAERQEQNTQLQEQEQSLRPLEKEKNEALRALTQLKSKLHSLEELDAAHEGLGDGPRAALDWAQKSGLKLGQELNKIAEIVPLTDLLRVTPGYESVLQSWLETRIEDLFVNDVAFAIPLLEDLRQGKQGRVSLQVLLDRSTSGLIKPTKNISEIQALLESQGFKVLGELSQFVKSGTPEYSDRLSQFIHPVCVVESATPMSDFLAQTAISELAGWSIVSMDGTALEQNGTLRGGSLENTEALGVLRRKQLIEELRGQIVDSDTTHRAFEEAVVNLKQTIEIARARLQTLQTEVQSFEIQAVALERDIHQTERALREAQTHLERLEEDAYQITDQEERAITEREELEGQLQDLIVHRTELEEKISMAEHLLTERETQFRNDDAQLQSIRIQEASLRERATSLKKERESVSSLIESRQRRLAEITKILARTTEEQAQFTGGESDLRQRVEELTLTLGGFRETHSGAQDQIEQANAKVNFTLETIKDLHKKIDVKNTESNQLSLEIEKISSELSHLVQNLEEKYGPGCLTVKRAIQVAAGNNGQGSNVAAVGNITFTSTENLSSGEIINAGGSDHGSFNHGSFNQITSAQGSDQGSSEENISSDSSENLSSSENDGGAGFATAENLADSGLQGFENDPSSGHSESDDEMSADNEAALAEEVERLRERIRRLGEVNVMAIEEFEVLKKRSDHLLTEKTDLERSLDNLREAIEHINKTSEERFKKAFEAIADRFERLFPIVFGGGSAKLTLIYPEGSSDILDAGVDILAQPPGKKVANITLLSGGEKALTAVSLIFAIFMVKPSPFCVLDEVDAPLDDANIGKFNALLREMSAKSQFILITHNKKTMELNDTLYGVTMEEPGVSKMVSIEMH